MPKVGYVALIGRPNAGKSTLVNALIGEKVSAISPRPQTTQRSIPGIYTDEEKDLQIIFVDTPGIHLEEREQFGSQKSDDMSFRINSEAFASLREADIIIRLIDPTRPPGKEDHRIDEVLSFLEKPIVRVETKQDLRKSYPGKDIDIKVDSTSSVGFGELLEKIGSLLPEGPYLYESDFYTDQTMEFRIREVVREQLFCELGDEIPYASYVEVGTIENGETLLKVQIYIHTETESQKTILIGKGGKKLQGIGTKSRILLEEIFGKKVFLGIRVKVHKNWRKDKKILDELFPKK